jgi:hypothetical protein
LIEKFSLIALTGRRARSLGLLAAGALIGGLVVGGCWVTGYLAQDDFNHYASTCWAAR